MAKILVFNNDTDRMETYYRGENEAMPYITNNTLRVREFRGSSRSNILWTTKRTMQSWNSQRYIFGSPIPVGMTKHGTSLAKQVQLSTSPRPRVTPQLSLP